MVKQKQRLHSGRVQWRAGKPFLVMWAKSLLLSAALLAGSAVAGVGASALPLRADGVVAVQPSWVMPTQYRNGGQQDVRPLRDVVEELRSRYGGELISARLEDGGRPIYLIRWRMPDGQVRDFRVDAAR